MPGDGNIISLQNISLTCTVMMLFSLENMTRRWNKDEWRRATASAVWLSLKEIPVKWKHTELTLKKCLKCAFSYKSPFILASFSFNKSLCWTHFNGSREINEDMFWSWWSENGQNISASKYTQTFSILCHSAVCSCRVLRWFWQHNFLQTTFIRPWYVKFIVCVKIVQG